jgi:hypothetical protein
MNSPALPHSLDRTPPIPGTPDGEKRAENIFNETPA